MTDSAGSTTNLSTESSRHTALRNGVHMVYKEIDANVKYSKSKLEQEEAVVLEVVNCHHNGQQCPDVGCNSITTCSSVMF